jgi:hypothetical protein
VFRPMNSGRWNVLAVDGSPFSTRLLPMLNTSPHLKRERRAVTSGGQARAHSAASERRLADLLKQAGEWADLHRGID